MKKEVKIPDIAILEDVSLHDDGLERIENYRPRKDEIAMKKATAIPVGLNALGELKTIFEKFAGFEKFVEGIYALKPIYCRAVRILSL